MTARRTSKKAIVDTIEVADVDTPIVEADKASVPVFDHETGRRNRYMSHANCGHATKGEAGKRARAACRRTITAWLNAEAEYLESANDDVSVAS